ncbi:beta and beta-prime subunits of DNA dependent RNA-polymerase [Rozella allomycis CSF55]|uniref:DNA-directed RNA polymerase subunit beta n=1 Tax=Rozella allomycis (strain CSF55) TaxID=988480 RepID=A0A4P9YDH1_ROZAC|nr:beta and beta-prime subunits of DNA dependent RNA-polymerase [Rozella allomycis CSF55]
MSSFETLKREGDFKNPPEQTSYPKLHNLIRPHLDSFNAIFDGGLLEEAINDLPVYHLYDGHNRRLSVWIEDVQVGKCMVPERDRASLDRNVYPRECRERGITYRGKITATIGFKLDDHEPRFEKKSFGHLPLMVKSAQCHLHNASPEMLVKHKEEAEEFGGYFIIHGIERIIRLLIVQRRNHVLALTRPSFVKRGSSYTQFGTTIRCARKDQSTQTVTLHYLTDGTVTVRFSMRKQEYLIPWVLIAKALMHVNDKELYELLVQGDEKNTFLKERVEILLMSFKKYNLYTKEQCLAYLGSKFRVVMNVSHEISDEQVGEELLRDILFVHLNKNQDKLNLLCFMTKKLYSLVAGDITADNPDSPMNQEILLSGFLYLQYFKEKMNDYLRSLKMYVENEGKNKKIDFINDNYIKGILAKLPSDIGRKMEYFLATGNLVTETGMDLQQVSGYTIVAEKLNFYRYLSHFRCVHRGSFFAELKTTTVRKLLPEAWGFLCPVHTPDGSPCGLLNHLSHQCEIVVEEGIDLYQKKDELILKLIEMGMIVTEKRPLDSLIVSLDGCIIGYILNSIIKDFEIKLRRLKIEQEKFKMIETAFIPQTNGGLYPGLFIFTTPARMIRPIQSLRYDLQVEMVGSLEQVYMNIACVDNEIINNVTTHKEINPNNILSVIANVTPFSDFNQSPRNMYQCQMGKQTMGTPSSIYHHRTDNKLYRIIYSQSPIVRPNKAHLDYGFDQFPNGNNAIVAVISYTGYDMEDAMILNKNSFERGFGHGSIYKSEFIDISDKRIKGEPICHFFGIDEQGKQDHPHLDNDGLPYLGSKIKNGDVFYSYINTITGQVSFEKYKGLEDAIIDRIRLVSDENDGPLQKINITLRIDRNPVIGDKFSSRHGQKGVCSQKYKTVDMPFTESGMTPDVIINPHAFPSRMTIGMFVESMAGKSGAMHGICQDATPFNFNEKFMAVDHFGEQLKKAGYNYYGNEPMYSGIYGTEMRADIYIGVVYYQRLRHMVNDKFQVRTTGPVHQLTQQPIKGRKRAGGIRFGEMERDSLLAHGVSFLLKDRLMNCSDFTHSLVCRSCGSILSVMNVPESAVDYAGKVTCRFCDHDKGIDVIELPFVFRYLAAELCAMNIKLIINAE